LGPLNQGFRNSNTAARCWNFDLVAPISLKLKINIAIRLNTDDYRCFDPFFTAVSHIQEIGDAGEV
jgi:hypothetical protein